MPKIIDEYVSMVRPAGIEPTTSWFEARRSIQLSYGRMKMTVMIERRSRQALLIHSSKECGQLSYGRMYLLYLYWYVSFSPFLCSLSLSV
jgi:hypothetical protein